MTGALVLAGGAALAALGTALAVATAAVSRLELSRWVSERLRGAGLATALLTAPGRVLGTAGALGSVGVILAALGLAALVADGTVAIVTAVLIGAVPLLLLVTFTIPRAAGRRWAEPIVRQAAPLLARAAKAVGIVVPSAPTVGRADLTAVLRPREPNEEFRADELAVLAGLIAFTERPVKEIMTPRTEIVAVAEGAPLREIATMFMESGYTRVPVYRDSLDQIIGMVHAFDLLTVGEGDALPLRPVTVVPGVRRCADLLFEMQRVRHHFAVVLDEFGGTAGIVTLEDLLEELIGEIFDEFDRAPPAETTEAEVLELDGTAPCDDVGQRFGVTFPARAETVGGLLAGLLGRIPRVGERVLVSDLEFDILSATPTRVSRVVVRRAGVRPTIPRGQPQRPPA